jgi:hypothetical protein
LIELFNVDIIILVWIYKKIPGGNIMRIFNKIIMIILLICLAIFCLAAIVNAFAGFISWTDAARRVFEPVDMANPYIVTLALLFIFLVCIFLLVLEFYRRRVKAASISSSKTGFAMITLDTIAEQIRSSVKKLDGLESVKVKVVPKSGGIIINMLARLDEEQDIPAKMQEVVKQAAEVASEKLGIKVLKNNLTIVGLTPVKPVGFGKGKPKAEEPEIKEDFEEVQEEETKEVKTLEDSGE